jgi:hypothetical protein
VPQVHNFCVRVDDRHNTIGLRLRYFTPVGWAQLEALAWNEVGFNFYWEHDVAEPCMVLKRGLNRFEGTIVWSSRSTDDEVVLALIVNELLYQKAREAAKDPGLHARLVKLIRAQGLVDEKRKALLALGFPLTDAKVADLVAQRKVEHPMFRYGVKVDSPGWRAFVKSALSVTSVVESMEKWSGAVGGT